MNSKDLNTEEKLKLVIGKDSWGNDNAGGRIYSFRLSDGPVGLRTPLYPSEQGSVTYPSVTYPSTQILSHTWNKELAKKNGAAIANDCMDKNIDVILGPGVTMKRTPTCGRNFEYYSEDPVQCGLMAQKYIQGVQEHHVGTCVKHFCCNNAENARNYASSDVDERTLREIYLRSFELAIKAKPWCLMSSYNFVNSVAMSANKKLYSTLRTDLGFDGLIMSDWWAVKDATDAVNSGLDLIMPYTGIHTSQLREGVANGTMNMDALNSSADYVIKLAEKCEKESVLRKNDLSIADRENIAMDIAREGMVLLKNNGILPLSKEDSVMVTGIPAKCYYTGGGSARVTPRKDFVKLEPALIQQGINAEYRESTREKSGSQMSLNGSDISCIDELTKNGKNTAVICVGNNSSSESEGTDRETIKLSKTEVDVIHWIRRYTDRVIVVIYAGSAIDMEDWIDDAAAVLFAGYSGSDGNKIVAEILTGKVNPSGKLTETFPLRLEDTPSYKSYHDPVTYTYAEQLMVGYRYYETKKKPVLFPFGYGLSYSEFKYSNLKVKKTENGIVADFDVRNISDVDGMETSQLYIGGFSDEEGRPSIELKGFEKHFIKAGAKAHYSITVDNDLLKYYSLKTCRWENITGNMDVKIGKNVHEIVLKKKVAMG